MVPRGSSQARTNSPRLGVWISWRNVVESTGWQGSSLVCWARLSVQSQGRQEAALWITDGAGEQKLVAWAWACDRSGDAHVTGGLEHKMSLWGRLSGGWWDGEGCGRQI